MKLSHLSNISSLFLYATLIYSCQKSQIGAPGNISASNKLDKTQIDSPIISTQKIDNALEANSFQINIYSSIISIHYDSLQVDSISVGELEKVINNLSKNYSFYINATKNSKETFLSVTEALHRCDITQFKIDVVE